MAKKEKNKPSGVCKLTGVIGDFQRSHILPKSVTKLSQTGERYIETSLDSRPFWRSNSWYDYKLVTKEGESILGTIDDKAIEELRRLKLIWSGWGKKWKALPEEYAPHDGCRIVNDINVDIIRVFFLSLLWRAAASERDEMSDISLPQNELEILRVMVLNQDPGKPYFLPMQLYQISTLGIHHNRGPIYESKVLPLVTADGIEEQEVNSYRFYFEGLICHIIHSYDENLINEMEVLFVGGENDLMIVTHTFEESRAFENLKTVIEETYRNHPRFNP